MSNINILIRLYNGNGGIKICKLTSKAKLFLGWCKFLLGKFSLFGVCMFLWTFVYFQESWLDIFDIGGNLKIKRKYFYVKWDSVDHTWAWYLFALLSRKNIY